MVLYMRERERERERESVFERETFITKYHAVCRHLYFNFVFLHHGGQETLVHTVAPKLWAEEISKRASLFP